MKKFFLLLITGFVLAALATVVINKHKTTDGEAARSAKSKGAPLPVSLTPAMSMAVPVAVSTFGTVEPLTTVAVKSQITGILAKAHFAEGQDVKEGDILFTLDARGPEAALKQAEAVLARDRVQYENSLKEAGRQEILLSKGISAQDARDEAVTTAAMLKAMVQSDEAAVDTARLQLSYCAIRAPVTGRTGQLLIHQGNLVKADDSTLVIINQIHPVRIRFVLPQKELSQIRQRVEEGGAQLTASPQDSASLSETGIVTFVDNRVDENTGTIQLKARFENLQTNLWPGQFVRVVLELSRQDNAVVIPESAVLMGQQGAYVYITGQDGRVVVRPVLVDRTVAGMSVIASGLVPGEEVVTDGQLRLKPGALVKARTSAKPESAPAGQR